MCFVCTLGQTQQGCVGSFTTCRFFQWWAQAAPKIRPVRRNQAMLDEVKFEDTHHFDARDQFVCSIQIVISHLYRTTCHVHIIAYMCNDV